MKILLVVYDNGSFVPPFPQGLAYIAGTLVKNGYDVEIYNQDMHHYPDEHLTEYLNHEHFDVVGVNLIAGYYQYHKIKEISKAINNADVKPIYILGGHGPSPEPEFFFKKTGADIIVIGEGEETIIELLDTIRNEKEVDEVKGIAYRYVDEIKINPRRELIKDIDTIPWPAYELFPIAFYRLQRYVHTKPTDLIMPVLSGRGCTFNCAFCLTENTKIKTSNGEKEIKKLKKDDIVLGFNEKENTIEETRVTDLFERKGEYYKITLEDKTELEISEEHPVYTKRGWVEVKDLKEGDEVLKI
jgi:radical SAM superfamily enzyme YgiQ (UPF0313 family)